MRINGIWWVAAVAAMGVAVTACQGGDPSASATGRATAAPSSRGVEPPIEPTGRPRKRDDAYVEAAEKFSIPVERIWAALTATRVHMIQTGGPAGERFHGTDEHPRPLDQSAHLDPGVVAYFATQLEAPESQGRAVMEFLMDEWNEYDEQAEASAKANNYAGYGEMIDQMADVLKIPKARAAWYLAMMIGRATGPPNPGDDPDPVERAIIDVLGTTPALFYQATAKGG
jgi:hypothetical protein